MRELQRKNSALENNQNVQTMRTLKSLFTKMIDALLARYLIPLYSNEADLEECARVISKLLDIPATYRDQMQDNFDKKKKKKGFLGLFK